MRAMSKAILLCVASLAVGASLGWMLHGEQPPAAPGVPSGFMVAQPSASRPAYASSMPAIDIEQVRAMLREELATLGKNGASTSPAPLLVKAAPTPELVAKQRVAAEEIETMIRGGTWGNEQRTAFHQRIGMLDAEQGARLLREVTMAISNGTLQMSTNGPPL
jgi:hypothetical protein